MAGYSYALDQSAGTTPDTTVDTTGTTYTSSALADGTWYFHIRAVDNAGNAGTTSAYTVNIDTTAPSPITGLARTTPDTSSTQTFTWNASSDTGGSGVAGYSYAIDQNAGTTPDTTVDTTGTTCTSSALANGIWYLHIRAIDNADNGSATSTLSFNINVSPTSPGDITNLQSSTHPSQSTWYSNNTPTFTWTASSNATGYSYVMDQNLNTVPDTVSEGSALQLQLQRSG